MTQFLDTPVDKSLGATGAWTDIDVSGDVPAGATGAIFRVYAGATGEFGLRKNGSTDDRHKDLSSGDQQFAIIGLDANRICEGYIELASTDFYLVGYTEADATFFTNATDKSLAATGAWTDIDLSGDIAVGSVAAIFEVVNINATQARGFGLRKNGSTDDRHADLEAKRLNFVIVGVDANRICEGYIETTDADFYLLGYLTIGQAETNAHDRSLGTIGSYVDIDESANAPANATGVFGELIRTGVTGYHFAARKNGTSFDYYADAPKHGYFMAGLDASDLWEGKIENVAVDFYTMGYFLPGITEKTDSDVGVGVDAQAELLATRLESDTGAGVDAALGVVAAILSADTGAGVDAISERLAALIQAETGVSVEAETIVKLVNVLYNADTGAGADAFNSLLAEIESSELGAGLEALGSRILGSSDVGAGVDALENIEDLIGVEPSHTAKLGGVSLWVPPLAKQNFTITYEENNIARFSFLLQNCDVNRTAITAHLTDDFIIYRGTTAVFTGTINSDGIEYLGIDKIRIPGYAKSIKLGYEFYKHMLSTDAEAVGSVQTTSLSGYAYRKLCSVIATTAGAQTNYQLELTVGESSGASGADVHCESHCEDFPNDIRFTKENGAAKHDYWIEKIEGVTPNRKATIIIEIASVPASGTIDFYMYYANTTASSESSIANTFIREIDSGQPVKGAWNLNGNALDSSGNGNNGTLNGGMGYTAGKFGQAGLFDGIDDYINCGSGASLDVTDAITIEAWIYPTATTGDREIIWKNGNKYHLTVDKAGTIFWEVNDEGFCFGSANKATNNAWNYIVVTYDKSLASENAKIFLNAVQDPNTANYTSSILTGGQVLIGGGVAEPFEGTIDKVRIYNRALSGDEISDLYGAGGDRYGYVTANYAGRAMIRKYASPEPTWGTWGDEQSAGAYSVYSDRTSEANNATVNDIELDFNNGNDGIYIGHNETFYTVKTQYSTKGVQSGTPVLKIEYSKGSGSWGTLDCIDTSQYYTADIGEHYLMIQNKPSDWAKDTINSISKFWIRKVSVSGSYSTNPKLDKIWISQTDVCRVQFDNLYLDDMLDDVLIDTDYSFQKALVNSTFETGVASWTGDMTQSSTQKHGGTYSAKLIAAAANVTMDSEFLPAAGVKDIAFWTYLITLTTPPFRYSLMYYDRNQTYISSEIFMTLTSVEADWTEHEYTHDPSTFPAGTKYVKLSFDFYNAGGNPAGTVYIDDVVLESTVPHVIVPGMRGEYYSKLQWVAGLANAATWEDGDGNKQNYLWWIDSDDLIHIAQSTSIAYNDITSLLSVLNNKLSYFDMGNRLYSLGSGDGINQTRAAVEDIAAQTANGLREALVTDARILEYEALKEFTQKALTVSKAATKVITLNMPTFDWFEGGYAISDTIKLRQPIWGIPDETTYRIIRCDIGKDRVKIDVGDPRQHLDTLQADLKAQIDVSDVYMAGATNIYAQSVQGNMERTAANVYPLILKIRIPDDAVKINKVLLDWNLSGFRTYTSVVEDGGYATPTSSDGGADVVTSAAHNLGTRTAANEYAGDIETIADSVETDPPTQIGDYGYLVSAATYFWFRKYNYLCIDQGTCENTYTIQGLVGPYNLSNDDHTENVDLPVALGEVTDQHDHIVNAYGNHSHTVNIADHHHTVTIPDHTHPLTSGIVQESLGSPALELYVNSVLVDNNYTGDNTDINIAGYMSTGAWNEIKLQPKAGTVALLRAELNAFVKIFIRSR